jgi:VWFA-related protein
VVDVTVTDAGGNPIHGLRASEFRITEDKAPQRVKTFEEHTLPATPAAAPDAAKLQPGVFTNALTVQADTPVNILLLDTLNTGMTSQAFVHGQLVKYLKNARPGTRMAIFALSGGHLVMLQSLTADPTLLRLAIARSHPEATHIPPANSGGGTAGGAEAQIASVSPELADAIQQFQQTESDTYQALAGKETLSALNQLARYLAGIPGRKNLIWFGGSFPVGVRPAGSSDSVAKYMADSLSGTNPVDAQYRETITLLTRARVAIYPADANGLGLESRMGAQRWASRVAMGDIADATGGHAFYNTNGLAQAVDEVTTNGASYYTLAYAPSRGGAHGEYRNIRVQLNGKSYKLAYRHGYYAEPSDAAAPNSTPDPNPNNQLPSIRLASLYTAPPETQIRFFAHLAPVEQTPEPRLTQTSARRQLAPERFRRYQIDFSVDPLALDIRTTPDGLRHAHLEFLTLVFDTRGRVVNSTAETAQATWNPAQFATAQQQGVRYPQQVAVPAEGVHTVRVLIHDLNTDKIGSMDLPASALQPAP